MTYQYRINKTFTSETNGPLILKIAYVNTNIARLYFTDKNDKLVAAENFDYVVIDTTSKETILPFQGYYFIVWTSNYEVLYKGRLTNAIDNVKQQTIRRVLPPEQQDPVPGVPSAPFPFPH